MLIVINNRLLEAGLVLEHAIGSPPSRSYLSLSHLSQHAGSLLAAHHGNTRIGPHEHKARVIGAAAHAVIAGPKRAANQSG